MRVGSIGSIYCETQFASKILGGSLKNYIINFFLLLNTRPLLNENISQFRNRNLSVIEKYSKSLSIKE